LGIFRDKAQGVDESGGSPHSLDCPRKPAERVHRMDEPHDLARVWGSNWRCDCAPSKVPLNQSLGGRRGSAPGDLAPRGPLRDHSRTTSRVPLTPRGAGLNLRRPSRRYTELHR
jgi:hypothetical protein